MGGGLLETNNQLERFTKNKKSKKLTYSMIGILLIIGSITLFKTYAFFEEKREFNVLKGRVPEFSHEDIQLAFTINGEKGEKFPTIDDGLVAKNVTCSNGASAEWNNGLWSLTNIKPGGNKKVNCNIEFVIGIDLYENVNIGDYVRYRSSNSEFVFPASLTGYTEIETMKVIPRNFSLWRVIRKNEDGSIDLVSEYLTSGTISFKGQVGINNFVGVLNKLAKVFETTGITSDSRYMGFNGQTEYITALDNFLCSTNESCQPDEETGGGDNFHITDIDLVQNACGTLQASRWNYPNEANSYWIASRNYHKDGYYQIRYVNSKGNLAISNLYDINGNNFVRHDHLRPIVTLKSKIQVSSGNGSQESPWKVN